MNRPTGRDARRLAAAWGIPLDRDFHALPASTVEAISGAADEWRYRKPATANGSRARYFYAYLQRLAARAD